MRSTLPFLHFLLLGVVWGGEQKIQDSTSQGRQLFPVKNENSGNVRIYGSKQALTGFLSQQKQQQQQQQQQQQRQKQQQQQMRHPQKPSSKVPQTPPKYKKVPVPGFHPSLSPQKYLDSFNEIQGNKISSEHDLTGSSSSIAEKKTAQTRSPALSALALMGFLYFLNRMQDVLQGKRKRRDVQDFRYGEEGLNQYLDAIDYLVEKFEDVLPEESEGKESSGRALNALFGDFFTFGGSDDEEGVDGRALRVLSYLGAFFAKIPETLGITNRASSRNDDLGGYPSAPDPPSGGFWSIFGERVGLVAKIMDFLDDPSPTRIGRSHDEVENEEIDPKEDYAVPSDLSPEDRSYLPPFAREADHSRRRRFAEDDMNVWYSVGEEEEEELSAGGGGGGDRSNEQMLGMMLRLFKNVLAS